MIVPVKQEPFGASSLLCDHSLSLFLETADYSPIADSIDGKPHAIGTLGRLHNYTSGFSSADAEIFPMAICCTLHFCIVNLNMPSSFFAKSAQGHPKTKHRDISNSHPPRDQITTPDGYHC